MQPLKPKQVDSLAQGKMSLNVQICNNLAIWKICGCVNLSITVWHLIFNNSKCHSFNLFSSCLSDPLPTVIKHFVTLGRLYKIQSWQTRETRFSMCSAQNTFLQGRTCTSAALKTWIGYSATCLGSGGAVNDESSAACHEKKSPQKIIILIKKF